MKKLDALARWGLVFVQIVNMQNSKRDPPSGGSVVWLFCCLVVWLDLLEKRPDDNTTNQTTKDLNN